MQTIFRFRGAEEIVVSNQVNGVLVEFYEGYEEQCSDCKDHPKKRCGNCPSGGSELKQKALISLGKSEARSVASAIMGAAAEL